MAETIQKSPNERLNEWLQENGLMLQVIVAAPRGGSVAPANFIPEGWHLSVQVVEQPKQVEAASEPA